ncbi:hypothetical protein [Streptomyces jumonjinensis]|uniref:hypothetical protein n=1 Tax=Streptomyces jumonjinensis TaxID=1945 RepID=UPI001297817D|nr:hypothetical protein [Streptomyces jumonjinensis]
MSGGTPGAGPGAGHGHELAVVAELQEEELQEEDQEDQEADQEDQEAEPGLVSYLVPVSWAGWRELGDGLGPGTVALVGRAVGWVRGGGEGAWARLGYGAAGVYAAGYVVVQSPYTAYAPPVVLAAWVVGASLCSPTAEARKAAAEAAAMEAARAACPECSLLPEGEDSPADGGDQGDDGDEGDEPLTLAEIVAVLDAAYAPGANGIHVDVALSRAQRHGWLEDWSAGDLRAAVEAAGIPVRDQLKVAGRGGVMGVHRSALEEARERLPAAPGGGGDGGGGEGVPAPVPGPVPAGGRGPVPGAASGAVSGASRAPGRGAA